MERPLSISAIPRWTSPAILWAPVRPDRGNDTLRCPAPFNVMGQSMRPTAAEYNPYFDRYISLVPGDKVLPLMSEQLATIRTLLGSLSEERAGFRYAPDKWSIRQSLGHVIDTERVFGFRTLWIARGVTEPLSAFEQDDFAAAAGHDVCPIRELVEEFAAVRDGHIRMLKHLPREAWTKVGTAGGSPLSVRAAAFILAGHVSYHLNFFRERYAL